MPRSTAQTTHRARASTAKGARLTGQLLARGLALAALLGSLPAVAWAEAPPGNALNPTGLPPRAEADSRGMTLLGQARRRTPNGTLYPYPAALSEYRPLGGGWLYTGSAEFGVFWDGGDEDEARFEKYTEWRDEAYLSSFFLDLFSPESGGYLELRSGSVGRDDQFYSFQAGRLGLFRLQGSFSGIPHHFENDARVLFLGVGDDTLTLPAGLVPGANTEAAIDAVLVQTPDRGLELQRDRSRIQLELTLRPDLDVFARYGFEDKYGERPYGGAFSFPPVGATTGGVVESAEPIDHRTHEVAGGLRFTREVFQANLAYQGSFFRNRDEALTLENPLRIGSLAQPPIERARFALAPDNDWHNLKGDFALTLPYRSRFTGTVSWSTMRQDEDLLPPTVNSVLISGGPFIVNLADWDSVDALSTSSVDAKIDTLLLDAALHMNPWKPLRLKARLRYFDQDNDTRYTALNPLTGEYGYIVEDGGEAVLVPRINGVYIDAPGVPGGKWRIRSIPYGHTTTEAEVTATYLAMKRTTLGLAYRYEIVDRDQRERDRTRESRIEASATTRQLSFATLRFAYEYAARDGSSFDLSVLDPFFTVSLPGYTAPLLGDAPAGLRQFHRADVADRIQQILGARMDFLLGDAMDLHLSARLVSDDYNRSDFGLKRERRGTLDLQWSYQPSPVLDLYLFGSLERRSWDLASIAGSSPGSDPEAGGLNYPFLNAWTQESEASTFGFGAGGSVTLRPGLRLQTDYSLTVTREKIDFGFDPAGGAFAGMVMATETGARFPELRTRDHVLETSLRWAFRGDLALRLYHRYQRSSIDDWSQAGLVPLDDHRLFFAHQDERYEASIYGIALQKTF